MTAMFVQTTLVSFYQTRKLINQTNQVVYITMLFEPIFTTVFSISEHAISFSKFLSK